MTHCNWDPEAALIFTPSRSTASASPAAERKPYAITQRSPYANLTSVVEAVVYTAFWVSHDEGVPPPVIHLVLWAYNARFVMVPFSFTGEPYAANDILNNAPSPWAGKFGYVDEPILKIAE